MMWTIFEMVYRNVVSVYHWDNSFRCYTVSESKRISAFGSRIGIHGTDNEHTEPGIPYEPPL